ncbi:MAG: type IV pilin N-terminal domain-containing protein [Petrotogales bacterium]
MIGTMSLLIVAVSVFSMISINVLSDLSPDNQPLASLVGSVQGDSIFITHKGGEPLLPDLQIILTINGTQSNFTAGQLMDNKSKQDGLWSVGEMLVYDQGNLTGHQIEAIVVDVRDDATLFSGILQRG